MMAIECPAELFEQFEAACGGWISPESDEGQSFILDALGDDLDYPGVVSLTIPELDDKTFKNWELFEEWCYDIRGDLMYKLIEGVEDYDEKKVKPRDLFESKQSVKEKIISIVCSDPEESADVFCVEIESNGRNLFLIYEDSDSWSLGHGDGVHVFR